MGDRERIALLNSIANRPEILRACAPSHIGLELSKFFEEPKNLMLGDARGVILFAYLADFGSGPVYEIHYMLTGALHGNEKLTACRLAIDAVFREKGAAAIFGSTPCENRAARVMNRLLGGRPAGVTVDAHGRDCVRYVLDRATWYSVKD